MAEQRLAELVCRARAAVHHAREVTADTLMLGEEIRARHAEIERTRRAIARRREGVGADEPTRG